jgi:hypothetical protein
MSTRILKIGNVLDGPKEVDENELIEVGGLDLGGTDEVKLIRIADDMVFEDKNIGPKTLTELYRHNAIAVQVGGSASNSANQNFSLDLSDYGFQIGDTVRIGNCYIRGDFGSTSEFISVGIGSAGAPKSNLGVEGYEDDGLNMRTDGTLLALFSTYTVVDIGGGVPGLEFYISPSSAVNFSPAGMPNGWWWELACDVVQES